MSIGQARWPFLSLLTLLVALLPRAQGQVLNLRFSDTDTTANGLGGQVYWEEPTAGTSGILGYAVYFAEDNSGTNQAQVGEDVPVASYTSHLTFSGESLGSFTHIIVYLRDGGGLGSAAYICLLDNPTAYARTEYVTTIGYTKANAARTALVTGCHAYLDQITVEMVETVKWDSGFSENLFDDSTEQSGTAAYLVKFQTGTTNAAIETALASQIDTKPLEVVFTGTAASSTYALMAVQAYSSLGGITTRADPDIARYIARASIQYEVGSFGIITRYGWLYLATKADRQAAITTLVQMFLGTTPIVPTYASLGGTSAATTAIDNRVTASAASCWQASSDLSHPTCAV